MIVLFTNGWTVFVHNGWRIADIPGQDEDKVTSQAISMFLSSYVPLPLFLLLTLGYKLIYRTSMVQLEEMTFERNNIPEPEEEHKTKSKSEVVMRWLLLI